jgi:2-amino-4-hydroxy-6-hydroxymethyldihydropteridine diphosphokinase
VPEDHHTAIISIGSNIGDKLVNCKRTISTLEGLEGVKGILCSPFYRTAPVDYLDQDWFVNAALQLEITLAPTELLAAIQLIQRQAGRLKDPIRFGPRIIDLDIIFYDTLIINSPELVIPHPRMHKRRFVLQPICDIDPAFVHPVFQKEIQTLLRQLPDETQRVEPLC